MSPPTGSWRGRGDLVMFGGHNPRQILDPTYERESGLARRVHMDEMYRGHIRPIEP